MRGREWGYSIGYRSIAAATRAARECSLSVTFLDLAVADELRRLADRDVAMATPGTLAVDGWSQRAYITAADPSSISRAHMAAKLTVVLLDGVWRKGHTVAFELLTAAAGDGEFLDLPYDLPHDLGVPSTRRYVDIAGWGAAPLRFTVYGPCVNPAIRIDGNWYRVDVTVPDGGYMVVDPLATPRSVTVVGPDGSVTDAFAKARRGDGLGGGEYIFQPASPGTHEVEWDRSFGFDLTWYEEEGEPPWS
ncbi:hypothetical protein [Senegalimassilia anaerobia]|uniref:hypothetical protein n=1 Tax=Senegalimassilia anaerobia TaxID=1473216 RepID=UPI003A969110